MKKQELVTEIEDLLISINNHFVDVENNARIPNIELDVISSKVSKLHEKIAVFKFLNENEGSFKNEKIDIENNKLNKIEELKSKAFEVSPSINSNPTTITSTIVEEKVSAIITETPKLETVIIEEKTIAVVEEKKIIETPVNPIVVNNSNLPDIKKLMSINDRLLFQNQLFGNVALDFSNFTDKINSFYTFQDANYYYETIAKQHAWKNDDETILTLKRYIHKRFNA
ncbi:MAG: hypothetical protein V4667_07855 [Bacteroidota bacterium]